MKNEPNPLCAKCRHLCKRSFRYFLLFCPCYDSGAAPSGIEKNVVADVYVTNLIGRQAVIFLN